MVLRSPVSQSGAAPLAAPTIPAGPVPTAVHVAKQSYEGEELLTLQVQTPQGTQIYFMRRNSAIDLATMLRAQAKDLKVLEVPAEPKLLVPGR